MKRVVIGLALAIASAAQTPQTFELRVGDETVPPGGLVQLKVSLTDPRPISTGKTSFDLDAEFFSDVFGVALFSSTGDVEGAALVRNGQVSARFVSQKGTFGSELDYPIMTVVIGTKPAAVGTKRVVTLNPDASFLANLLGNYSGTVKPGTITVGGSLSVSNVVPGGGLLPAGSVVKLLGTGFTPDTTVQIELENPPSAVFVNAGEIDLKLSQPTDMRGKRIRVKNRDGSQVTYYSYLRAAALGSPSRPLLQQTVPVFSNPRTGGYLPSAPAPASPGSYTALALENSNQSQANVGLDLLSADGQVTAHMSLPLPGGMRYVREIGELFTLAAVPAGSGVRVSSDAPVHMLGLIGDDAARDVTPVSLLQAPPPAAQLTVSPVALRFDYTVGDALPGTQALALESSAGTISFTAIPSPASSWLSVSPVAGTAPASLSVAVNPAGLAAGVYSTGIKLSPVTGTAVNVTVTLTVKDRTAPLIGAIVNAASQQTGAVSPGEIVTVYGSFPAVPATGAALDSSGKVATSRAGVRILFDGVPAPLTFVSATQVNAVVPYEVSESGGTKVQAELAGILSPAVSLATTATAPAVFTTNASGFGPAAALNQDLSVNTAANPAARRSVISVYATGEGRTAPAGTTGNVTGADLKSPVLAVTATIGGQPASVSYAGSAPGFVAGALQVNIEIPDTTTPGTAVEVILRVGNKVTAAVSRAGVTIAVQ